MSREGETALKSNKGDLPTDFNDAIKIANIAFQHIQNNKTPPNPKSYELWYSYACAQSEELNEKIEHILERNGTLTEDQINQIHQDFFQSDLSEKQHQEQYVQAVETEMNKVLTLVQNGLSSNEGFEGYLTKTCDEMAAEPDPTQIREILQGLLAENIKMREETSKLSSGLSSSKAQIEELHSELEKIREQSLKDALTQLGNRRFFETTLENEIRNTQAENGSMCLVIADIDHFKKINDTYGHVIGDQVLKFVASLLKDNLKGRDTAARYGGEEFVIILPDTDTNPALHLVERIRKELSETSLLISGTREPLGQITSSFGIATLKQGECAIELLKRADENLYCAKKNGRNRVITD